MHSTYPSSNSKCAPHSTLQNAHGGRFSGRHSPDPTNLLPLYRSSPYCALLRILDCPVVRDAAFAPRSLRRYTTTLTSVLCSWTLAEEETVELRCTTYSPSYSLLISAFVVRTPGQRAYPQRCFCRAYRLWGEMRSVLAS